MTVLEWDRTGERVFEAGVNRGVLFTIDGDAFPWNGLINVTEETTREVKSYWMDGMKYLDHHVPGSYSAKLDAYTYPDILDELTGVWRFAPGVFLHDQRAKVFHLSYRTGVGNDIDQNLGYKLHLIYNVMAVPSGVGFSTVGENVAPSTFSWNLSGTPQQMFGARPTSHISLNSLFISPELLETIEALLYGSVDADPALPSMVDLLTLIEGS
jgi:hypothetical protein